MEKRAVPIYMVDAFTKKAFGGNPAAVCLLSSNLEKGISDDERQKLGAEMNLSETAFVTPMENGDFKSGSKFGLRWFTPAVEIDLCGHATLAAAAVLFNEMGNTSQRLDFSTRSGILSVEKNDTSLTMNFPLNTPTARDREDLKDLLELCVGDLSLLQDVQISKSGYLLLRLRDDLTRQTLEELNPKIDKMINAYNRPDVKAVGITLRGSKDNGCVSDDGNVYDFISRFFAPWVGIDEDPVTGSWHTELSAYWSEELSKLNLFARQCSKRGGELWLGVHGDRVNITGQCVINLRGTFYL